MVAATALADVMEQAGQQQQLGLAQAWPHLVRDGETLVGAGGEAGQVAQHHQGVLVDRVGMEQVELHASGHPCERR